MALSQDLISTNFTFLGHPIPFRSSGEVPGNWVSFFCRCSIHRVSPQKQPDDKLGHCSRGARTALQKSTQWGRPRPLELLLFLVILWSLARWLPPAPDSFWKGTGLWAIKQRKSLGLLGTKKGHNIHFISFQQDIVSQKGRNKQKNSRKEKEKHCKQGENIE